MKALEKQVNINHYFHATGQKSKPKMELIKRNKNSYCVDL